MIRKALSGATLVLVAAACGDSTGPGEPFDPVQSEQSADAVFDVVAQNQALASLGVLGNAFNFGGAPAAIQAATAALPVDAAGRRDPAARLRTFAEAAVAFASASPQDLFPPGVVGNTFVFNPETGEYEPDPTRSDAPANGVRFVLYAVDPVLHQVVLPLTEIGHVDLIDVSTSTANRVQIVAVIGDLTALDYIASAQLGGGGATFSSVGFIANATETVDFNLSFTASASGRSVDYSISVRDRNQSIRLVATVAAAADPAAETTSITLTITDGDQSIVLTAVSSGGQIEGSISHNGSTVVTFSGDEDAPIFTTTDGRELTAEELEALGELGHLIEEVFDSFEDLLRPAFALFGFDG